RCLCRRRRRAPAAGGRAPRHPAAGHRRVRGRQAPLAQRHARTGRPHIEPRRGRLRLARRAVGRARLRGQGRAVGRGDLRAAPRVSARRATVVYGIVGVVVGLIAVTLTLLSDHEHQQAIVIAFGLVFGWSFLVSGLVANLRRPDNHTGLLLIWVALTSFFGALSEANGALAFTIGFLIN